MIVIVKFHIEMQIFIELHGNSKMLMTSYPSSSDSNFESQSKEYRSDDITKNFFCISAFCIPCIGGA